MQVTLAADSSPYSDTAIVGVSGDGGAEGGIDGGIDGGGIEGGMYGHKHRMPYAK